MSIAKHSREPSRILRIERPFVVGKEYDPKDDQIQMDLFNSQISAVEFGFFEGNDESLAQTFFHLGKTAKLTSVDCSFLTLGAKSWPALIDFVAVQPELKNINLSGLNGTHDQWQQIISEIFHTTKCEKLRLESIESDPRSLEFLFEELSKFNHIQQISIRGNPLTKKVIATLSNRRLLTTSLVALDVSGCALSDCDCASILSSQSDSFPRLKSISFSGNVIGVDSEPWIQNSSWRTSVEHLNVRLTRINDDWISDCFVTGKRFSNVRRLDIQLTRVSSIGVKDIAQNRDVVPRLEKIWVGSHQVDNISPEILEKGDIEPIFDAVISGVSLNEAKVIMVGDGRVGKTSLCRRLLYPEDSTFDPLEPETHNLDIHRFEMDIDHFVAGTVRIAVRLLDFGGQDILHSTHRLFLTRRAVYVLVVDGSRPFDLARLHYWLQTISYYGGDAPIILVVNKTDKFDKHATPKEYFEIATDNRYRIVDVLSRISAANDSKDRNVQTLLRNRIAAELGRMNSVLEKVGEKFFSLRQHYEEHNRGFRYHSVEEYFRLAGHLGIESKLEKLEYLKLLHEFATVFYWGDSDLGNDQESATTYGNRPLNPFPAEHLLKYLVFEPIWLKETIYRLIRDVAIENNHGLVSRESVKAALRQGFDGSDDVNILSKKTDLTLAAMHRFGLLFSLAEKDTYLIPGKLPTTEPYTGEWKGLQRIFEFGFLPESVIQRFIVRMHDAGLIVSGTYWRTGVVVKHYSTDSCSAIVRADINSGTVFVRTNVRDSNAELELLAVVEHELRSLHSPIDDLHWEMGESRQGGGREPSSSRIDVYGTEYIDSLNDARRATLETLLRRYFFLLREEATISSAAQKFELREDIENTRKRILEINPRFSFEMYPDVHDFSSSNHSDDNT